MKLGKEEIKKAGLGGLLLIALLYCYFNFMLAPLAMQEKKANADLKDFDPKIAAANEQIQKTRSLEMQSPAAAEKLTQITALIPEGAPIAWFPPRITDFFKKQGIEKTATRLNGESADKDLAGFRKLSWSIDLPKVEFMPLATAIAGLENEEPLLEITNVQIEATKEDLRFEHAVLTVSTIVKQ